MRLVHHNDHMSGLARLLIPLLTLPLLALDASAQENARARHRDTWALAAPEAPSPREAAARLLARASKKLVAGDALELADPSERTSLTASHFFFPQTIGGVPVLNGGVAVSIRSDGTASLHDRTGRPSFGVLRVGASEAVLAAVAEGRKVGATDVEGVELVAWVGDDGVARAHQRVVMYTGLRRWAVFVDAETGAVAWTEPLFMTAQGQVFDPNPVAALNDPTLLDGDDSDTSVPQGAYTSVELYGLGGSGPIAGPHVAIVDLELPTTARADAAGSLAFTRSRDEFEEVNAYFHLDRAQRYLQSLGFSGDRAIVGYAIPVDPHGSGGNDNSSYQLDALPGHGRLFFGDGGVDDAEDADILLHEYGHAIQDSIVPSGFTGPSQGEPRALGEGFCDYWAFSSSWRSSRATGRDPFCVGDWDARCAPGPSTRCGYDAGADCLRRVDGTKTMADYLLGGGFGSEHLNGEIWSSALREVFVKAVASLGDDVGRRTVDRTILESHFGLPPNPSFRTAALRLIDADRRLNHGALTASICAAMTARGIVETGDCDLGLRGDLTLVESPAREIRIPDNDPAGVAATLRVSDTRVAEEIFVRVDIAHPRRGDLRLTLTAPDGASIVLQVENGDSAADIVAVYGLDAEPSQPLSSLAGKSAAGTWTLRVTDTFGVDEGRLVSWGMMFRFAGDAPITTRSVPGDDSMFIPVAGSVAGAFGTRFVSDVRIGNPGTSTARTTLFFTPSGADGATTFSAVRLEVPPGETVALDDIVASLFHESGTGAIEIRGDAPSLVVASRIYNATASGTYGQFVRVGDSVASLESEVTLEILHLSNGPASRSNLGVTEVGGGSGTIEVRLVDASGTPLGLETVELAPFSHLQMPLLGGPAGTPSEAFRAEVRVVAGDARVVAYGSVVDNVSGDAIFVPGVYFPGSQVTPLPDPFVVPAVIRAPGANATFWRSDLRVMNRNVFGPQRVELTFHPADGAPPEAAEIVIPAAGIAVIDDVLSSLFSKEEGRGWISVFSLDAGDTPPSLVVTSRTWTTGAKGAFGQFIPAKVRSDALSHFLPAQSLVHIDSNDAFRCNVGLTEAGNAPIVVRVRLFDAAGAERFVTDVPLPANSNLQFNLAAAGAPPISNGRLTFEIVEGFGRLFTYASVVDNRTGDPIFVSR